MLTYEEHPREIVVPFRFEDEERHQIAIREAGEVLRFEADSGQGFSGLHLNRGAGKAVVLKLNAFAEASNNPEQQFIAYQNAAANPDKEFVMLDLPSHGYSDNMTRPQRKEIAATGGFSQVGEAQAEALRNRLPNAAAATTGASTGAIAVADVARKAAELGVEPVGVIGYEMLGLEKRPSPVVAFNYFVRETLKTSKLYGENNWNEAGYKAFDAFKWDLQQAGGVDPNYRIYRMFQRDPRFLTYIFHNMPMASGQGLYAFERFMDEQPTAMASLVFGGLSAMCRWRKLQTPLGMLQQRYPGRLLVGLYPDDSHGMNFYPESPRIAADTKARIDEMQNARKPL
ncbi:MAG TPA: hypothetical protein VHB72_03305 [Candidatus Saccharimonadales bacterium]|nr:hypothetical protein [Candidatus Saccharimonadales bacterium]